MDTSLWDSVRHSLAELSDDISTIWTRAPVRARPLDYGAYADLELPNPKGHVASSELRREASKHLQISLEADVDWDAPCRIDLPKITNFGSRTFSADDRARMTRWWDIDPKTPLGLSGVGEHKFEAAHKAIRQALDVLRRAAPELFAETAAIIDEIVLVSPDGTEWYGYHGGSAFGLWGAVLINVDQHEDWMTYYKTIVHEAGHNLLFAMGREEPFVTNALDATYASPVRTDPRPMDGIFHAAFVNARECLAFDQLLSWLEGDLSPEELEKANGQLEASAINVWQCLEVLRSEAALTELGQSIARECEKFMTRKFALLTE